MRIMAHDLGAMIIDSDCAYHVISGLNYNTIAHIIVFFIIKGCSTKSLKTSARSRTALLSPIPFSTKQNHTTTRVYHTNGNYKDEKHTQALVYLQHCHRI